MINQILKFHSDLEKGECVKLITQLHNYTSYINRTDLLRNEDNILLIFRANGAKVAINTDKIISCCVVRRL